MDFFSGSNSSAQALIDFNLKNDLNNNFISIQFPEVTGPESTAFLEGYKNICEIGKERVRRVVSNIDADDTIPKKNKENQDLGFKVFNYGESSVKKWYVDDAKEIEAIEPLFTQSVEQLKQDWKPEDLLTEILLLEGFPLTSRVEADDTFTENMLYRVSAPEFCSHALAVCLDEELNDLTISQLRMGENDIFVCLDSALTDEQKTRLVDRFTVHVI
jgi:adenine-specific DNA-methyltransferase